MYPWNVNRLWFDGEGGDPPPPPPPDPGQTHGVPGEDDPPPSPPPSGE